jgi:ATP-dependent RNA helicase DDX23/PRP28
MGIERKKRKIRKMNEKKFVFDWDANEDTSPDFNPIYASPHQAQLYGRGKFAGIDLKEQRKNASKFYEDMLDKRRTAEQHLRAECVELSSLCKCKD